MLQCVAEKEHAAIRLFVLENEMKGDIENVEVYKIQVNEKVSIEKWLDVVLKAMVIYLDKPFALQGSGLCSLYGLALYLEISKRGLPLPVRFIALDMKSPFDNRKMEFGKELKIVVPTLVLLHMENGDNKDESCWRDVCTNEDFEMEMVSKVEEMDKIRDCLKRDVGKCQELDTRRLQEWNCRVMKYPDMECLQDLFRVAVEKSKSDIAVVYEEETLTFEALNWKTDVLAKQLQEQGVGANKIVGIYMEHCIEFVIAYVAILKAGGAYMPLEIVYPPELLVKVLQESEPVVVLSKKQYCMKIPTWQTTFNMDRDWIQPLNDKVNHVIWNKTVPDDLGFVVMSSGTTGVPKGICVPHRAAVHSYHWRLTEYPYEKDDRVACHVFFVWELMRPMLGNVPLYVIPDCIIYDSIRLADYIEKHRITRILFTPSLLQLILDTVPTEQLRTKFQSLRIVWLCGEVVTIELRNRFMNILPKCYLLNLYSVSECHDVSACDLNQIDHTFSPKYAPCGVVMPNVRAYILDENMKSVHVGTPGELFIGGPCLARGYLNRPKQTASRFIMHQFDNGDEIRLYKTGDRARFLPNGNLELIGRCDFMVKIRGYSVVLGAVEAALAEHPKISTAVVITEGEEGADKRLIAYLVPEVWDDIPNASSVRLFLKDKIPHYAVPHVFVLLEALPINDASGKLDRKKLPAIESALKLRADSMEDKDTKAHKLPTSGTELELAQVWSLLLRVEPSDIYIESDFFEIGGHSLLATRLASSIREVFGVNTTLGEVLQFSNFQQMSEHIDNLRRGSIEHTHEKINLPLEAALDHSIYPAPTRKTGYSRYRVEMVTRPPRHVLLTGATGFLGTHILHSLLQTTDCTVYCLTRAKDEDAAFERIMTQQKKYQLWNAEDANRIVPVIGDLSKPLFGMKMNTFKILAGEIDAIIHNGAAVNLVMSYEALKAVNILGTQEVLRLAVTNGISTTRVKPVHYVSTNGVFPFENSTVQSVRYLETSVENDWENLVDGYSQSKWVAEQMCLEARSRGLPVSILRPGNMSPSSKTGIWNQDDFIYYLLKGCIFTKKTPSDTLWKFDMTPVNFAADSIAYFAAKNPQSSLGQILHVQNPNETISAADFFQQLSSLLPNALESISYESWKKHIERFAQDTPELQKLHAGIDNFSQYLSANVILDASISSNALSSSKISCPKVNSNLMQIYLSQLL